MKNKSHSLSFMLFLPMLTITLLQLIVFLGVLFFGGEFDYIKRYAYNAFVEENMSRSAYVENTMTRTADAARITAEEIALLLEARLQEKGMTAADLKKDKQLNRELLLESAELLISLLRQGQANDVYLILDSGTLYDSGDVQRRSGLYIRDMDASQDDVLNNTDLLMEAGLAGIADRYGITLDYEWSACLEMPQKERDGFDFYDTTMQTASQNAGLSLYDLGYWSGFGRISRSAPESLKYTVPLITQTGEVFGVVGIGFLEKQMADMIPGGDFSSMDTCYVLGFDQHNMDNYVPLMHKGAIYERLVTKDILIDENRRAAAGVYEISAGSIQPVICNVQSMNLYGAASPYRMQKWAFLAVGNKDSVMAIYDELVRMFLVSSVVSVIISMIGAALMQRNMMTPVKNMIQTLRRSGEGRDTVTFSSSNIREIDRLGEEIQRLQINVRESSSRVSKIIGMVGLRVGVFMYDPGENTVFLSSSLIELLGFDELPQKQTKEDAVIPMEEFRRLMKKVDCEEKICNDHIFRQNAREAASEVELVCSMTQSKEETWLKIRLTRDRSNVIGVVQDETDTVVEKKRIEFERDYDVLTGLLNRRAYLYRLEERFRDPAALKVGAMIMIDLDNLKYVNDTYGHDFGDDYIKAAAGVFGGFMEYGGLVSRLSGDEFNIFLSGYETKDEIRAVIGKIQEQLLHSSCVLADGTKYKVRASMGVAWYPDDDASYTQLMKYADFAMYTIKHTTKGDMAEFDLETYNKDSILMTGIEEMNRIIDEKCVRFAFQPIVSARSGKIYGYELLMRPQSEILRTPLDFIRLARAGAKLHEIEQLTWRIGLQSARQKMEAGEITRGARIFINSLANCLIRPEDIHFIEQEYADLLPNVVLEMLEGEEENEAYTAQKQRMVRQWHAQIALDDFGNGYNSEYLLIKINPDLIKIDRSIISGCGRDRGRAEIIRGLVHLAKERGIKVLAEGVETKEEMQTVIACGVDLLQGYYIAHPQLAPEALSAHVEKEICDMHVNGNWR